MSRQVHEVHNNLSVLDNLPSHWTFQSKGRHTALSSQELSERWHIGIEQARQTIRVTTQRGIRSAILPMARRYKADQFYQPRRLNQKYYTDTFFPTHKSLDGNTCMQVYSNDSLFTAVYPMRSKQLAGKTLKSLPMTTASLWS